MVRLMSEFQVLSEQERKGLRQSFAEEATAQEFLDEENQITCEKCKTKRQCMKTLSLFKLPQYMKKIYHS